MENRTTQKKFISPPLCEASLAVKREWGTSLVQDNQGQQGYKNDLPQKVLIATKSGEYSCFFCEVPFYFNHLRISQVWQQRLSHERFKVKVMKLYTIEIGWIQKYHLPKGHNWLFVVKSVKSSYFVMIVRFLQ